MSKSAFLTPSQGAVPCLLTTWETTETELYYWLVKQTADESVAADLLQETFLKALQQQRSFCDIDNQKAWLYRVAHNLLVDSQRREGKRSHIDISDIELVCEEVETPTVDKLCQCLPKALNKLSTCDRTIITECDLLGCSQQQFAKQHQLTLTATKSRIQRARTKLRDVLLKQCHIVLDEQQKVSSFHPDEH